MRARWLSSWLPTTTAAIYTRCRERPISAADQTPPTARGPSITGRGTILLCCLAMEVARSLCVKFAFEFPGTPVGPYPCAASTIGTVVFASPTFGAVDFIGLKRAPGNGPRSDDRHDMPHHRRSPPVSYFESAPMLWFRKSNAPTTASAARKVPRQGNDSADIAWLAAP
jgi:hypothetical protein